VYLPRWFRSGNVVVRPHAREFEIALGTTGGRPADRVIPLDELVIGVSDGRFYVRWTRTNKNVLASAGHMLNNVQAPDVCRFVDNVRRDGQAHFSAFDGGPAAGLPVLPRVQSGRIVLSLAQWRIDDPIRKALSPLDPARFASAFHDWRARWQVPRHVYLSFGDNRLLIDLDCRTQVEELRTD